VNPKHERPGRLMDVRPPGQSRRLRDRA
jgi:hypothetical protein